MFDNIMKLFKKFAKEEKKDTKVVAKERLHLVLMQDRANVSADFMELMKQEIIEVIKKYIDVDENSIDVKLTNKVNNDGTTGAPILYANIPILNVKDDTKQINIERNFNEEGRQGAKDERLNKNEKQARDRKKDKKNEEENEIEGELNVEELEIQEHKGKKEIDEIIFSEETSDNSEIDDDKSEEMELEDLELDENETKE